MNAIPVITLDGPSGAGKGTVARALADTLGWHILDSGALYRITALKALNEGVALDDEAALARLASDLDVTFVAGAPGEPVKVLLDGRDVTPDLRLESTGDAASRIAPLPAVRQALLDRQRRFRQPPGLVADGRDMGTVVFPDAPLKIFLTASAEERARRRFEQLKAQGVSVKISALLKEIQARDDRDMNRSNAPLKPADDAVVIDTTSMPADAVLARVLELWQQVGQTTR